MAAWIARQLGMVASWANVQTIRLAIESEAIYSGIALGQAADLILASAKFPSHLPSYSCPAQWELREIYRENRVDRFWFEDARWRSKFPYLEFQAQQRHMQEAE